MIRRESTGQTMKILIADDDPITRNMLDVLVKKWGFCSESTADGLAAWKRVVDSTEPLLCILDWIMPGIDGVDLVRKIRRMKDAPYNYVILLTCKNRRDDVVRGINAGADDFITKPFHPSELKARIRAGMRILELQQRLDRNVLDLRAALARVKRLQGLIPICSYCKRIRDDGNYWHQVEKYISEHSEAEFTHGICPKCAETLISSYRRSSQPAGLKS